MSCHFEELKNNQIRIEEFSSTHVKPKRELHECGKIYQIIIKTPLFYYYLFSSTLRRKRIERNLFRFWYKEVVSCLKRWDHKIQGTLRLWGYIYNFFNHNRRRTDMYLRKIYLIFRTKTSKYVQNMYIRILKYEFSQNTYFWIYFFGFFCGRISFSKKISSHTIEISKHVFLKKYVKNFHILK